MPGAEGAQGRNDHPRHHGTDTTFLHEILF